MYYCKSHVKPSAYYTRIEAAKILGISVSTMYRLRRKDIISPMFVKGSSRPVYKGSDLKGLFDVPLSTLIS